MDDLRMLAKMKGVPMWKIAEKIGISEPTLFRWLRKYDVEHHKKIMDAINQIMKERGEVND